MLVCLLYYYIVYCILGVVNIGGKKYARLIVGERPGVTPGVRRGRRKRIETLQPGQLVQYKYHWGVTPDRRLGLFLHIF